MEWVTYPIAVVGIYSAIAMSKNESDFLKEVQSWLLI